MAGSAEPRIRGNAIQLFDEVVGDIGGDPACFLARAGLPADALDFADPQATLPYARVVTLLNDAAATLRRPDFGLHLASRQPVNGIGGALSIAMRNCPTLGDAFRFCAEHMYTFSDRADLTIRKDRDSRRWILQCEAVESGLDQRQIVELSLLRTVLIASFLSGGKARPRGTWLRHAPLASVEVYRSYFRCGLSFQAPMNAVTFDFDDDLLPVIGCDREVYRLAESFIDRAWMRPEERFERKVRHILSASAKLTTVSAAEVAAALNMHVRTFQRRLRDEGLRFDEIKDALAREAALRYLRGTRMPLAGVATALGYSGLPAFSRRCQHWFHRSPRVLRRMEQP